MNRQSILVFIILVLLGGGGSWWLLQASPQATPPSPPVAKTQNPNISWSVPRVDGPMFPGTSSTTIISFRSDQNLSNVVIDITPSLSGVVSASPARFASIVANQPYQVTLTLTAPPEFRKREFGGTIHLRNDGKPPRTYARPVDVGLRTDWSASTTGRGYEVKYPTNMIGSITPTGVFRISTTPVAERDGSGLWIYTHNNPLGLNSSQWWSQSKNHQSSYETLINTTVANLPALIVLTQNGFEETYVIIATRTTVYEFIRIGIDEVTFRSILSGFSL